MLDNNREAVLQIRHLTKNFGHKKVVDDLNLELYRGEVFGFLGPNGAGKTTTIKMAMSLLRRDTGEVLINGYDIDKQFEKAMAKVGGIVENPETYKHMTGLQNLRQYARMRDDVTEERIREVVEIVRLGNRIDDKVKKYSLGMKQRLGVAQAIMHHPDLLILDEPTNGLDPAGIKELRDILKHLAHEENICVMVSSHLLSEMQLMCDRVGIIMDGKLVDVKLVDELINDSDGNHHQFQIRLAGELERAMQLIDDYPVCKADENILSVTLGDEAEISELITRLVLNQIKIREVSMMKRNLEEVFIEMTDGEGVSKLVKFPGLVKNEYIKIFTKVSTWVLLILVVVAAIGYNGFVKVAQVINENQQTYYWGQTDYIDNYKRMIDDLKSADYDNKETEIEKYQFLIDNDISYRDWRNTAADEVFQDKYIIAGEEASGTLAGEELSTRKTLLENMLTALRTDNWKSYYTLKVNQYKSDNMLSAEQKEAYSYSYQYALTHNLDPDEDNWQNSLLSELSNQKQQLAMSGQQGGGYDAEEEARIREMEESVLKLEYQLEHNLKSVAYEASLNNVREIDFWTVLGLSNILINVISGVIIIIAGGSIANEFTNGTIKFLLINPVKRWKIFLSKYAMILSMSVLLVLGFFVLNVLCGGILFGFGDILNPYLYVVDGTVHQLPGLLFVLWQYLIGSVNLLVMGTLAFAISSLLRNSAVAIGVSIFALLAGSTVTAFLGGVLRMDWARFLIFANVDLNAVMSKTTMFQGMTVGFSLAVIAVHMVIFFLTAWDGFMRRDSI